MIEVCTAWLDSLLSRGMRGRDVTQSGADSWFTASCTRCIRQRRQKGSARLDNTAYILPWSSRPHDRVVVESVACRAGRLLRER